ncbi:MAG: MFS transporter [Alphaproteobacteria bacterium]|nr:MFS transporter [Alphaproteobacteria bacterium]
MSNRLKGLPLWISWLFATAFYAYQYILRVLPNIMYEPIVKKFSIDAHIFGQFSGVYYTGYALAHIPLGILLDRFGVRKTLPPMIIISVCGLLPILYSDLWLYPVIGRYLTGIGSAAAPLAAFYIIRIGFSESQGPRMLSWFVTFGLLGAIYGGTPTTYFCQKFGYESVLKSTIVFGFFMAFIGFLYLPKEESKKRKYAALQGIWKILKNKKTIIIALSSGLMVGSLEGFPDAWGGIFLTKVYGLDLNLSAHLTSLIFLGMCFGGPCLAFIAEYLKKPIMTVILAGCVMTITFCSILLFTLSTILLNVMFVCVGICCAYQMIAIYKAASYVDPNSATLATAIVNMIIMIFGHILHTSIGAVVAYNGGMQSIWGLQMGISVIPMFCLMGVVVLAYNYKRLRKD